MAQSKGDVTSRSIQAGIVAWLVPGGGHLVLGQRGMAAVFFLAISVPYALGLAVGGIKNSVNPWSNKWLFLAEMGIGSYTPACLLINRGLRDLPPEMVPHILKKDGLFERLSAEERRELEERVARYVSFAPESEIAQIYLATAGLLNLLAILDALARAQRGGLPTFAHEAAGGPAPSGGERSAVREGRS